MRKKYAIKEGYQACEVIASKPLTAQGNGRYVLKECTQRELKFLYEVIGYEGVIVVDDGKE